MKKYEYKVVVFNPYYGLELCDDGSNYNKI